MACKDLYTTCKALYTACKELYTFDRMLSNSELKTCTKCKRQLPATAFYKDVSRIDGLSYYCRECHYKVAGQSPNPRLRAATDEQLLTECRRRGLIP